VADKPEGFAITRFEDRYRHLTGLRSVDTATLEDQTCIAAIVAPGFDPSALPRSFMGSRVIVDYGERWCDATGAVAD
jgi:hypothetical protein